MCKKILFILFCTVQLIGVEAIAQCPIAGFSFAPAIVCTGAPAKFNSVSTCGSNPALTFSGNSSAFGTVINSTGNVTMEIWAKWSGASNNGDNQILFYNGNTSGGGYGLLIQASGNLQILHGGSAYLPSPVNLTPGIWQHVALVRTGNAWSIYLDGTEYVVSNSAVPRAFNTLPDQLSIGLAENNQHGFYGDLDEAKFWEVTRNTSEIQSDMANCSATGLRGYWSFNAGSGSTAADGSGNGNALSLSATSVVAAGASTGVATYAWDFGDGTNATARNNVHTFSSSGSSVVSLTVTDGSCSATFSSTITVNQPPTPSISGTATNCNLVTLTASGGGTYSWNGGNSTGTAINTFSSSNTYTVTVTNPAGCTATASQSVTVNALPATPANEPLPTVSTFVSGISGPGGLAFDAACSRPKAYTLMDQIIYI